MHASHAGTTLLPQAYYETTLWQNRKAYLIALMIAAGPFQFGFDNTIIAGFQAQSGFLKLFGDQTSTGTYVINRTFQQLIASLGYVGQIIIAVLFAVLSKRFGRLELVRLSSYLGVLALLLQVFGTSRAAIYAGRTIIGGSNVLNYMNAIVYSAEIAPPHLRSSMSQLFQTFTGFGVLVGAFVSNAYASSTSKQDYQVQLSVCFIIPAGLFLVTWFIPESPRWLTVAGKHDKARNALIRLRGTGPQAQYVEEELEAMVTGVEHERQLAAGASYVDLFRGTNLRRTLLAIGCIMLPGATGNAFLSGYSTYFFQVTGLKNPTPFIATLVSKGVCGSIGGILGLILTRYIGRRPLLLSSFSAASVCMFTLAAVYTADATSLSTGKVLVAMISLYTVAYYGFMAPVSWTVGAEMSSNRLRSKTFALAFIFGDLSQWLISFTAPYFINGNAGNLNWGAKYGFIWGGSLLIAATWIYFCLPETRNRSFEDLDEMFEQKLAARDFANYQTQGLTASIATAKEGEPSAGLEPDFAAKAENEDDHIERV